MAYSALGQLARDPKRGLSPQGPAGNQAPPTLGPAGPGPLPSQRLGAESGQETGSVPPPRADGTGLAWGATTPPRSPGGGAGRPRRRRGGAAPSRFPGCTGRGGCLATSPGHVARCPLSLRHLRSPAPGCTAASAAAMNIFRLTGDLSHLAAIIILLLKIWKSRSCAGACGRPLGGRGEGGGTGRAAPGRGA